MEHTRLRLAPAMMSEGAHAGEGAADTPCLDHRLIDLGTGVPPFADSHDAPEFRQNTQVLRVVSGLNEFASGGDAPQRSYPLLC